MENGGEVRKVIYSIEFERALSRLKRKDKTIFQYVIKQIEKIIRVPNVGKPLRYTLKSRRRVHVGSFVLVYEFHGGELRFLDFDHHDRIYKKYF